MIKKESLLLILIFSIFLLSNKSESKIAVINGDCSQGREIGNLKNYYIKLQAKNNSLGYINIRSNAACFEQGRKGNILGTVPCGTILYGFGPLKNADYSAGVAYAVAIQDKTGKKCKGYVSYTVVQILSKNSVLF